MMFRCLFFRVRCVWFGVALNDRLKWYPLLLSASIYAYIYKQKKKQNKKNANGFTQSSECSMQIHAERNTIIKRWRLHGQLLKFHAQGDHQTVPLMAQSAYIYIYIYI